MTHPREHYREKKKNLLGFSAFKKTFKAREKNNSTYFLSLQRNIPLSQIQIFFLLFRVTLLVIIVALVKQWSHNLLTNKFIWSQFHTTFNFVQTCLNDDNQRLVVSLLQTNFLT